MDSAYLRVVAELAQAAVHVLDRFHMLQKLGKVRAYLLKEDSQPFWDCRSPTPAR